jgi:hypothetical protein
MKSYDPRVVVKFNPTAYANAGNMVEWLEEQLIPVLGMEPTLLALDLFGGHKTNYVLDLMKAHDITVSIIPAGCTSLVQPLHISVNRPFKDILKVKHTTPFTSIFFSYLVSLVDFYWAATLLAG